MNEQKNKDIKSNISCVIKHSDGEIQFDGVEASILINHSNDNVLYGSKVLLVMSGLPTHVKNDIYRIIFDYCKIN